MKNKHLYVLDIYRIFAVFLVFIFHLNCHFNFETHIKIIDRFINQGATSMTLFFMLSGFILYYLHGNNFLTWKNYIFFVKKRCFKIYPLYISFIIIAILLDNTKELLNPIVLTMQIIPLQSFFPNLFRISPNGGMWFISVIFCLYLNFPFLAFILKHTKINSFLLFFIIYLLCNYLIITDLYFKNDWLHLYVSPIFRTFEFFIGMIVAKIFISNKQVNFNYKICNFILISCFLGYIFFVGGLSHSKYINDVYFNNSFLNFDIGIIPIFAIILYFSSIIENGLFYKLAKTKICQYLANISYSFFLAQCILILYFIKHNFSINSNFKLFIFAFLFNLILAILMHEFIQKNKLLHLIKKLHFKFLF